MRRSATVHCSDGAATECRRAETRVSAGGGALQNIDDDPLEMSEMCLRLNPGILSASQTLGFTDLNITGVRLAQIRWPSAARHRQRTYCDQFNRYPVCPVGLLACTATTRATSAPQSRLARDSL